MSANESPISRPSAQGGVVGRIYGNLGKLLSGKAGAGLISLAYMVVAVRVLGPTDYGVLILVHTFAMTVGGIIEFPGWHAVVRYGAQALERGDQPGMMKLLRFAALVEGLGGLCALLVAAVLGPLLGARFGWSQTAIDFALPYSFAVLASIRATAAGYLQLCGRFDLLGAHVLISPLVRLVGAAGIALVGGGLHAFLVVWLVAALAEFVSMWALGFYVLRRNLPGLPIAGTTRGVRKENAGLWRFMIGANVDATFGDLATRIAPLAVGWVMGPAAAGLYAVAQRATVIISQPAQLLGQAAYAELARLAAGDGGGSAIRQALWHAIRIALGIALPVLLLCAVVAHPLSRLIGGDAFERAGDIILLLGAARVALLVGPAASAALVALGRPGLSVAANLGSSLAMLPLLPLMMMQWGLVGAGWHALAQSLVAAILLGAFLWKQTRS